MSQALVLLGAALTFVLGIAILLGAGRLADTGHEARGHRRGGSALRNVYVRLGAALVATGMVLAYLALAAA